MDLHQIIITHNRIWTKRELLFFLVVFAAALVLAVRLVKAGRIRKEQAFCSLLALAFLAVVYASTVFTRTPGTRQYQLELFWSWKEIWHIGKNGRLGSLPHNLLLQENLLNMVLLFPFGLLLPFIKNRKITWWEGFLAGGFVSASIECLQLILCRGLFEWDDMIHNGIGCMIGCILADVIREIWKRHTETRNRRADRNGV
ncbi:VanZ family protein [Kineothrix sp. MSJ-39]|uniref:VanZ family protein n=1 Tax=Kineothrix sp. MSJ-39 TaxID=2841533 RepID=UPI001C10F8EE|nr:VanZ family protein [Kineothrix sp. MSJ-39]MBU5430275.1 VanZ family protein [Kineothrix sp. MSJ-39]